LESAVSQIISGATLDEDNGGQILIYTGLMKSDAPDQRLVPFVDAMDESVKD